MFKVKATPANVIRDNFGSWAVPPCAVPAVAHMMTDLWHPEPFDQEFYGQYLQTTYFDTQSRSLRKARLKGDRYCTLRLRAYHPAQGAGGDYPSGRYAVSVKTEEEKDRFDITPALATALLHSPPEALFDIFVTILSPTMLARLWDVSNGEPLMPVFTVLVHRFAVEDEDDRLTLDVEIHDDLGCKLPYGVLEFKSASNGTIPPAIQLIPGIRPVKMSKYLHFGDTR
jgi:hypothetical protein